MRKHDKGRFDLPDLSSPTADLLAKYLCAAQWTAGETADFSWSHLEFSALNNLEYKHRLHRLLQPDLTWMQPCTYYLDEDCWRDVVADLLQEAPLHPWILKPALLNNGQNIRLFANIQDVAAHYRQTQRLGGPHVLQTYILHPHLLQGPQFGHKYSIRMFVVVTAKHAYLYPHGYFNVALQPYVPTQLHNLKIHLTNEHLSHDLCHIIQIPTWKYKIFQRFEVQIQEMCRQLFGKFLSKSSHPEKKIGFLGLDFMVDAEERVWLLECNHGPCFPRDASHPLYLHLYHDFWQAVVAEIMEPYFLSVPQQVSKFYQLSFME